MKMVITLELLQGPWDISFLPGDAHDSPSRSPHTLVNAGLSEMFARLGDSMGGPVERRRDPSLGAQDGFLCIN